mgnify:CR=1 FL=1
MLANRASTVSLLCRVAVEKMSVFGAAPEGGLFVSRD